MSDIDIYAGLGAARSGSVAMTGRFSTVSPRRACLPTDMRGVGSNGRLPPDARRKVIIGTGRMKFQKILSGNTLVPWYTDTRQENRALLNEIGCHPL